MPDTPVDSILLDTKKVLGFAPEYTAFDQDIIMHVNSVFSTLTQLGIGPIQGFMITDVSATWESLLGGDLRLNSVKSLVYLKLRLIFDPPATSFGITAFEKQVEELQWRLSVAVDPSPVINVVVVEDPFADAPYYPGYNPTIIS